MKDSKGDKQEDPQGMQPVMLQIQQPSLSNSPFLPVLEVPVHNNTLL
jgi:hypothetical protein